MKIKTLIMLVTLSAYSLNINASSSIEEAFENKDYQTVKTLLKNEKNNAEKNYYLGRVAFIEKDLDLAEEKMQEAITLKPNSADYHYWFGMINLRQAANASIFTAPSYASSAKEHLKKSVELAPENIRNMQGLIAFYLGAPAIAGGSVKEATKVANNIKKLSPLEGDIAMLRIYQEDGEEEKELQLAEQLVKNYSSSARALLKAGFSFQNNKQYKKAFNAFEKANLAGETKMEFSAVSALYQIGRTAALSKTQIDLGIESLEQYIHLETDKVLPSENWAKYRLASLYNAKGNKQQAKKLLTLVVQDKSDELLYKRAKSLLKKI